jgi:hypothetical protein
MNTILDNIQVLTILGLRGSLIAMTATTALKRRRQQQQQQQQSIPDESYHTVLFNPVHFIT